MKDRPRSGGRGMGRLPSLSPDEPPRSGGRGMGRLPSLSPDEPPHSVKWKPLNERPTGLRPAEALKCYRPNGADCFFIFTVYVWFSLTPAYETATQGGMRPPMTGSTRISPPPAADFSTLHGHARGNVWKETKKSFGRNEPCPGCRRRILKN